MVKYLYIIALGEFEISIRTLEEKKKEADKDQLVGFLRPSMNAAVSSNSCAAPVK